MNRRTTQRMLIMLAATALVFGTVFGLKSFGNRMMNKAFNEMPAPPVTVSTAEAQADSWPHLLEAVGSVKAVNVTEVTTEAAGIVKTIQFKSGQSIVEGAVVATLDSDADLADLKSLEAVAKLARLQLDRAQQLVSRQVIARSDLDQRRSEYDAARAKVDAQRERVEQKTIRAPFSGELGIREVSAGQYLAPGTGIVSLQSLSPIYLDFNLPEQQLSQISIGQDVAAEIDSYPGHIFQGRIAAIDPHIDTSTRNFIVQASFDNGGHELRPGMFARVRIDLKDSEPVVVIPQTAVSYNPYGNSVYVIGDRAPSMPASPMQPVPEGDQWIVKRRFIRTGRTRGDFVVVTEGLKAGERVASTGLLKLQTDSRVIINNSVQPGARLEPKPSDG